MNEKETMEAALHRVIDEKEALELEISLRQKQTIRDALERERARRRIEELERDLQEIAVLLCVGALPWDALFKATRIAEKHLPTTSGVLEKGKQL